MAQAATWTDRAVKAVSPKAQEAAAKIAALAKAPVKPGVFPPLDASRAATVRVGVEPLGVAYPGETWDKHGPLAEVRTAPPPFKGKRTDYREELGNEGNDRAALRAHLLEALDWGSGLEVRDKKGNITGWLGRPVRVVAWVEVDGRERTVVLEGTEAAIRRALPDRETVKRWLDAGATEFPLWNLEHQGDSPMGRVRWVPMDQVPRVLQMEFEGRGHDRHVAQALVHQDDLRAELAALVYQRQGL